MEENGVEPERWEPRYKLSNVPPELGGFFGGALVAAIALGIFGLIYHFNASGLNETYGIGIFCMIPFAMGFASAMFVDASKGYSYGRCAASAMWSVMFVSLGLLAFAFEGIICLLMAAPLIIPLALLGAWGGYGARSVILRRRDRQLSVVVVFALVPLFVNRDSMGPPRFAEHVETTAVVINAPPETVWPYVCSLKKLPPPTEILFRAGIAHPIRIDAVEPKLGGRRFCRLSTGDMPESIEVFQPNQRLVFKVLATPPSVKETNPFGEIHTRHQDGYYVCRKGEFRLEPLPGGRTRLIGTSWYANRIAPDPYWALWTDTIVEEVHLRVMGEIRRRSELDASLRWLRSARIEHAISGSSGEVDSEGPGRRLPRRSRSADGKG